MATRPGREGRKRFVATAVTERYGDQNLTDSTFGVHEMLSPRTRGLEWQPPPPSLRLFMQDPKEGVRLKSAETYSVQAGRPHLVTNAGRTSVTFLAPPGIGEYDFVPLI